MPGSAVGIKIAMVRAGVLYLSHEGKRLGKELTLDMTITLKRNKVSKSVKYGGGREVLGRLDEASLS